MVLGDLLQSWVLGPLGHGQHRNIGMHSCRAPSDDCRHSFLDVYCIPKGPKYPNIEYLGFLY